jgi:poly(beta-D-mannuronate) lyase
MAGFSGSFPHDLLDLNHWRWQGPVKENGELGSEGDGEAISVPSNEADTSKMETYRDDPWFVLETDGDGAPYVRLRSPAKGSTTSGSETTRSELREMHHPKADEKSSWDATGSEVHNLKVRLAVTAVMEKDGKASRVAVAQVHKTSKFGIIVFLDGESGQLKWKQESPAQSGSLGEYTLGKYVNIGLSVRDGKCKIYVDDVEKAEGKLVGDAAKTCYFKTGCYNQDNNSDDGYPRNSFNEVHIAAVKVRHDEPWTSGGYEPIGPGVGDEGLQVNPGDHDLGGGDGPLPTGTKPRDLIQFNGPKQAWKLNLDTNSAGDHPNERGGSVEKDAASLAGGFVKADHFEVVENGTAVRFRACLNGATTGGSTYPRTELREMKPGSPTTRQQWDIGEDTDVIRRLTAEVKVTRAPSTPGHRGVVIGQIHDSEPDGGGGKDILEIMYDGKKNAVGFRWDDGDGNASWQPEILVPDYAGKWFTYRIEVDGGTVRLLIDEGGGWKLKADRKNVSIPRCYFKAGAYTQSNARQDGAQDDDYGEALFRSIKVEVERRD